MKFFEPMPDLIRSLCTSSKSSAAPVNTPAFKKETLTLWTGDKDYQLIVKEGSGRWLQNANSEKLVMVPAGTSGLELAPPNWAGYPLKLFAQNWRFIDWSRAS
jgi:hypothetical protein